MHLRIIVTMQVVFVLSACSVQLASPHDVAIEARASALHEGLIGFELAMRRRAGTPEGDPRAEANRARFEAWRASIETMQALSATADPRKVDCRIVMARVGQGPDVDGGENPRQNGAGWKTGTGFAVTPSEPNVWTADPLSTPLAAEGGGRRPAFTAGLPSRHTRTPGSGAALPDPGTRRTIAISQRRRAVYARICAAANT